MMDNPFIILNDQQLSSVIFVQDYLQLDFDGYKLTYYVWPIVTLGGENFSIIDREYRNVLCSLIAKKVIEVAFNEHQKLNLKFQGGDYLEVDLKNATGEVIYFTTPDGQWSSL